VVLVAVEGVEVMAIWGLEAAGSAAAVAVNMLVNQVDSEAVEGEAAVILAAKGGLRVGTEVMGEAGAVALAARYSIIEAP
jgi:hypothetical protein